MCVCVCVYVCSSSSSKVLTIPKYLYNNTD